MSRLSAVSAEKQIPVANPSVKAPLEPSISTPGASLLDTRQNSHESILCALGVFRG